MRRSVSESLGSDGEEFAIAKVWRMAKPSVRAQATQLPQRHRAAVPIDAPRGRRRWVVRRHDSKPFQAMVARGR